MRRRPTSPIQISERELTALTCDLDEMHRATLPVMHDAVAEWKEDLRSRSEQPEPEALTTSRRRFLVGTGAAFGGLLLAACGSTDDDGEETGGRKQGSATEAVRPLTGDFAIAALAASIENLAVNTYQAGLEAATAGRLGEVPPAVAAFAKTAQQHHGDHAGAWNQVLTNGRRHTVTGVDRTVKGNVDPAFAQVNDVAGLARLALELEKVAAATYLKSISAIKNNGALKVAASIQPVEMQHAAILHFALGEYPVPDSFAKEDGARSATDQIG